MKRYLAMLLAALTVLSFVGCKTQTPEQSPDETEVTASTDATEADSKAESANGEETNTDETYAYEILPTDYWGAFIALVESNDGFEVGYTMTNDRQVVAGGKDGTYWITESQEDGSVWSHYAVGSGTDFQEFLFYTIDGNTEERDSDVNTLTRITEEFTYLNRNHIADNPVVPMAVENEGFSCDRYNYDFGALSYDISRDYGITVRHSNIDDEDRGFALWYIHTGSDVEKMEKP